MQTANMAMATMARTSSPIDAATTQHARIFWVYIAVLLLAALLTAVLTFLVWKSGNRLQDAVRKDADARIAEARQGVAKLENDNLRLRAEVATLQKDAADAKAAQQKVEVELAKQQERAARAERELLQLKESLKDRKISTEQREKLIGLLTNSPKGPTEVWWVTGVSDSYAVAFQIQEILRTSGWPSPEERMAASTMNAAGMFIACRDFRFVPQHMGSIGQAFHSVGMPLTHFPEPDTPDGVVRIYVGHKPQIA